MRHMEMEDEEFFFFSHYRTLTPGQKQVVRTLVDEMAGHDPKPQELPDNVVPLRVLAAS
jgi:hypothetical protein